jgi:hypothetical protein
MLLHAVSLSILESTSTALEREVKTVVLLSLSLALERREREVAASRVEQGSVKKTENTPCPTLTTLPVH